MCVYVGGGGGGGPMRREQYKENSMNTCNVTIHLNYQPTDQIQLFNQEPFLFPFPYLPFSFFA